MAEIREQFKNNAISALNGGIDADDTSLVVDDGTKFPSVGRFRIMIGTEIMICTARSSNTLTVIRGQEGTTGAAHADDDDVLHIVTKDGLFQLGRDNDPWFNTSRPVLAQIIDSSGVILTSADFTWFNQGGASIADQNGTMYLQLPSGAGHNLRGMIRSYSTVTAIAGFVPNFTIFGATGSPMGGIIFKESVSNLGISISGRIVDDKTFHIDVSKWTSNTALSTNVSLWDWAVPLKPYWLKAVDNGTNIVFSFSHDGINWIQAFTEARTTFLTTDADRVGFFMNMNGQTNNDNGMSIVHWGEAA